MKVYVTKELLARTCSDPHDTSDLSNTYAHLTNCGLNDNNKKFKDLDVEEIGDILVSSTDNLLDNLKAKNPHFDPEIDMWPKLEKLVIKSVEAMHPTTYLRAFEVIRGKPK